VLLVSGHRAAAVSVLGVELLPVPAALPPLSALPPVPPLLVLPPVALPVLPPPVPPPPLPPPVPPPLLLLEPPLALPPLPPVVLPPALPPEPPALLPPEPPVLLPPVPPLVLPPLPPALPPEPPLVLPPPLPVPPVLRPPVLPLVVPPPAPPLLPPALLLPPVLPPPVPLLPVPVAGGAGGTGMVGGSGAGAEDEPPSVGVDGLVVGGVVVDSVGLLVDGFGVGFFVGLGFAAGREVTFVDSSRGSGARGAVAFRRGSDSVTKSALVRSVGAGVGTGVGAGWGGAFGSFAGSSPGSGSTALDRTGPPARLTLIKPPYSMTSAPKAYARRRSNRLRRPVLSTKTGAGVDTEITSVSGMSASMNCGFFGCCEFTRRA
jgi:hypothetical protein